jgi:hypothetical protein
MGHTLVVLKKAQVGRLKECIDGLPRLTDRLAAPANP